MQIIPVEIDLVVNGSGVVLPGPLPDKDLKKAREHTDSPIISKLIGEIDRLRFLQSLQQA